MTISAGTDSDRMPTDVQPFMLCARDRADQSLHSSGVHDMRHLVFIHVSAYHTNMLPPARTARQRIIEILTDTPMTTEQLARMLSLPERQVEEHLTHVVKTVARDRARRFMLDPSSCLTCGFTFRDRTRLTRPSRCPHCRSEGISSPRYHIATQASAHAATGLPRRRKAEKGS